MVGRFAGLPASPPENPAQGQRRRLCVHFFGGVAAPPFHRPGCICYGLRRLVRHSGWKESKHKQPGPLNPN